MRKWFVGFLVVGTVLWLWSYHEEHLPCSLLRDDNVGIVWDCHAGSVQITLASSRGYSVDIGVSAPTLAVYRGLPYVMGVKRNLLLHHIHKAVVRMDSRVDFTVVVYWIRH